MIEAFQSYVIWIGIVGLLSIGVTEVVKAVLSFVKIVLKAINYIAGCIGLLGVKIYNLGKRSASS